MAVLTKYAVYSRKLKAFWGRDKIDPLEGDDSGFTPNIEFARLYTLDAAERMAEGLFEDHQSVAVPIRIVMSPVFDKAPPAEDTMERMRALAQEFDEMTLDEADRLSKSRLKKYREARRIVKEGKI